ncbi:MAG: type I DNA topoisomerase [Muribaculaceae bacterium]
MSKNLVIVESPAKAKTIEKFLGKEYKVLSSYGHIRDLKSKSFSIDIKQDFAPIYEIPADKKEIVSNLKSEAAKADIVWLASDEDREGEAIAWHLFEVLKLNPEKTRRIVFHEITKTAIVDAIKHPREIDLSLVDAQQARRVLDRIVGFELSPVLWKKIKPSLSAGRVQSVAVRLIVERENEIKAFTPEEYFRITGDFSTKAGVVFKAELNKRMADRNQALQFVKDCVGAEYTISDVSVKPITKSPAPPFTTSTLQQEASRKLGFSVSQTMMMAQRLYEQGFITYMRTDSVNLSSLAINTISQEIKTNMGEKFLKVRKYHTSSKGAQEAHEAIRPTYISNRTIEGTPQEKRLYELIWKRTLASQMADAELLKTTVDIDVSGRNEHFVATSELIKFDGFLRVYIESHDDEADDEASRSTNLSSADIKPGESLSADGITAMQRFTQQPPRYSEASLVKKMEELGIGRPSTYAPTISTIQQRKYVEKSEKEVAKRDFTIISLVKDKVSEKKSTETITTEKGRLMPTDTGVVVNNFLTEYFPDILDYNFTAKVEQDFDVIAQGKQNWTESIRSFYDLFHPAVDSAMSMHLEHKVGERVLGKDPKTGKQVSVKIGRFGPVVQLGEADDVEKPQFASLQKDQSVSTLTLEQALKLFEYPKTIGTYEGAEITVAVGRFGPYVKHDGKYVSIPKSISPAQITAEQAIELINEKRSAESNKIVKAFDEDDKLRLLNGRYGIYIVYDGVNYKIPKTYSEPEKMTFEQCMEVVNSQKDKPAKVKAAKAAKGRAKSK